MYFQDDNEWSRLRWYDESLDKAIELLTDLAQSRKDCDAGVDGQESTLGQSGCWHVSIASMLAHFGEDLYGRIADPRSLLKALRDSKLGTLSGYVRHPFVDPLSIITKTNVQLLAYRDFGKGGVAVSSVDSQNLLAAVDGKKVCAVVNVCSHEFFGKGDSHYVLIHQRLKGDKYAMHDPSDKRNKSLPGAYKKIFQITLYQRAE